MRNSCACVMPFDWAAGCRRYIASDCRVLILSVGRRLTCVAWRPPGLVFDMDCYGA